MSSMVTVFGKGDEVLKALWDKRSSKSSADVTLICIGDYMYCHRKPMMEASPKFKKMLSDCPAVLNLGIKAHEALFILNVVYGLTFYFPSDLMPRFFSLLNEYEIPHPPVHVSVGPLVNTETGGSSLAVARIAKQINQDKTRKELNVVKSVNMARKVSTSRSSTGQKASKASEMKPTMSKGFRGSESDGWSRPFYMGSNNHNPLSEIRSETTLSGSDPKLSKKSPVAKKLLPSFTQLASETLPANLIRPRFYQVPLETDNEMSAQYKSKAARSLGDLYYNGASRMDNSIKRPQKVGRSMSTSNRLQTEMAGCLPDQFLRTNGKSANGNDKRFSRKDLHSSDRDLYGEDNFNGHHITARPLRNFCFLNGDKADCFLDQSFTTKGKAMSNNKLSARGMHNSERILHENCSFDVSHKAVGSSSFLQSKMADTVPELNFLKKRKTMGSTDSLSREGMQMSGEILHGGNNGFDERNKARTFGGLYSNQQREKSEFHPAGLLPEGKVKSSSDNPFSKEAMLSSERVQNGEDGSNGKSHYKEGIRTRFSGKFHFRGNLGRRHFCFLNNAPGSCIWCPQEFDNVSSYSWEYGYNSSFSSCLNCTGSFSCSSCFNGELFMESVIDDNKDCCSTFDGDNLQKVAGSSILNTSGGKTKSRINPWYCDILENELKHFGAERPASRKDIWHQSGPIDTPPVVKDNDVVAPVDRTEQMGISCNISPPADFNLTTNSTELVESLWTICKPEVCEDSAAKMAGKIGDRAGEMASCAGEMGGKMEDGACKMEYSVDKMEDHTSKMEYGPGELSGKMQDHTGKLEEHASKMEYSPGKLLEKMQDCASKLDENANKMEYGLGEVSGKMQDRAGKLEEHVSKMENGPGKVAGKMQDRADEVEEPASKMVYGAGKMQDRAGKLEEHASKMEYGPGKVAGKMEDPTTDVWITALSLEALNLSKLQEDSIFEEANEKIKSIFKSPRSEEEKGQGRSPRSGRRPKEFTMDLLHEETSAFEKWWTCASQPGELAECKLNQFGLGWADFSMCK